jgi:hypothetical protein
LESEQKARAKLEKTIQDLDEIYEDQKIEHENMQQQKRTNNDLQNIHIKLKIEYILCYRKLKTLSMSLILDLLFSSRDDENEEQTIS